MTSELKTKFSSRDAIITRNRIYALKREILNDRPKRTLFGIVNLPAAVSLRDKLHVVWDQLSLGSCTANSLLQSMQFLIPNAIFSRLFLYYLERTIDNSVSQDAGSTLSSGLKALTDTGCCFETTWPYDITKFAIQPPVLAYNEAKLYRVTESEHVDSSEVAIKQCLAAGYSINLGIAVYSSFESDIVNKTGQVPLPGPEATDPHLGDHAVVLIGYDDSTRKFMLLNSWGSDWGDKGAFYVPYEYITSGKYIASDLWKIGAVSTTVITTNNISSSFSSSSSAFVNVPTTVPSTTSTSPTISINPNTINPLNPVLPSTDVSSSSLDNNNNNNNNNNNKPHSRVIRERTTGKPPQSTMDETEELCHQCAECCVSCAKFSQGLCCYACGGFRWFCCCCGLCCQKKVKKAGHVAGHRFHKKGDKSRI